MMSVISLEEFQCLKRNRPAEYKLTILAETDGTKATDDPGTIRQICRWKDLYLPLSSEWRGKICSGALMVLSDKVPNAEICLDLFQMMKLGTEDIDEVE